MIQCKMHHLEERCAERGYSLDQVRPCIIADDGETLTVDPNHPAYPRPRSPSLARKALGFATAAGRHLASGAKRATQEEVDRRFAICQSNQCGFYDGRTCRKCGCFVSNKRQLVSKLSWADQACPIGLWGPLPPGSTGPAVD